MWSRSSPCTFSRFLTNSPSNEPTPSRIRAGEGLGKAFIVQGRLFQSFHDHVALRQVETGDADGRLVRPAQQIANDFHDLLRLNLVLTLLINAIYAMDPQRWCVGAERRMSRDRLQARGIKMFVTESDQVGIA